MLKRLWAEEEGQSLVEYGLMMALLGAVALAVLVAVGHKVSDTFVTVNSVMITVS
jgi:Flp pilus assembly pilin Flp